MFGIFRRAAWFFRTGSVRLVPAEIQCLQTRLGSLCADPSGQSLDVVFPCFLHVFVQCTASDSSSGIHEFVKYPTAIQTARLEAVRVNTLCLSKVMLLFLCYRFLVLLSPTCQKPCSLCGVAASSGPRLQGEALGNDGAASFRPLMAVLPSCGHLTQEGQHGPSLGRRPSLLLPPSCFSGEESCC